MGETPGHTSWGYYVEQNTRVKACGVPGMGQALSNITSSILKCLQHPEEKKAVLLYLPQYSPNLFDQRTQNISLVNACYSISDPRQPETFLSIRLTMQKGKHINLHMSKIKLSLSPLLQSLSLCHLP